MPPRLRAALPLVVVLAGCRDKGALPAGLAGSFVPQDTLVPEVGTHLNVTATGFTVTRHGIGASGSLTVNGEPVLKGTAEAGTGGAALFATLRCEDDRACTFTTKSGCEGSISGDGKGNVVLIATGECSSFSGKWMGEKAEPPRATAGPAVTCPPCPQVQPPPLPTGSSPPPSTTEAPKSTLTCTSECSHVEMACVQECKVGDSTCVERCAGSMSTCVTRCR